VKVLRGAGGLLCLRQDHPRTRRGHGNTSQPHLHYHLQDSPTPFDGDGLPAEFTDYLADGKPVARGIPVKEQQIERAKR
jgi:hypothetical protein